MSFISSHAEKMRRMGNDDTTAKLRERYLSNERKRKTELVVVCTLWLLGCPLLCLFSKTNAGTTWDKPDEMTCGLPSYSISASMTGHYPKVWGCIFATLSAVLIVQRTSNGLCPCLKLGWLRRFSPLINDASSLRVDTTTSANNVTLARDFWRRIEKIETFGYIAASCLVALVILDSKYFPIAHIVLSQVSFAALYRLDWSVGTLGRDFPHLLPTTWTSEQGRRLYYLGIVHFAQMMLFITVLQTLHHTEHCNDFWTWTESQSIKLFGDTHPEALHHVFSFAIWYNEYAFGLICIYIQLLDQYEYQLWDFVGEMHAPYLEVLPRFSVSQVLGLASVFTHQKELLQVDDILLAVDNQTRKMKKM